jgi:hypothetical protein
VQKKNHTIAAADNLAVDTNTIKIEGGGAVGMQVAVNGAITLTPEATMEDPSEPDAVWIGVKVNDANAGAQISIITTATVAYVDLPGFGGFRLRQTAGAGTGTSWLNEVQEID